MRFSWTDAAKKIPWNQFKKQHWDLDPFQGLSEPERERFLAEKWQEITGKNLKFDDKKGEGE